MHVVAPNMKLTTSGGLTRLADSLARLIAQPDDVLRALGLTRDNVTERRQYVVREIDTRYHTNPDDTLTEWVEGQWFDADDLDAMILGLPVLEQLRLVA